MPASIMQKMRLKKRMGLLYKNGRWEMGNGRWEMENSIKQLTTNNQHDRESKT